jgi:hypothetical protein
VPPLAAGSDSVRTGSARISVRTGSARIMAPERGRDAATGAVLYSESVRNLAIATPPRRPCLRRAARTRPTSACGRCWLATAVLLSSTGPNPARAASSASHGRLQLSH